MPKHNRRQSHMKPPTSSRDANDNRHNSSRHASSAKHRPPGKKTRARAPSVDSQDTDYDPRDRYYLSRDDKEEYVPQRKPAVSPPRRGRSPSRSPSRYLSRSPSPSSRSPSPYSGHHRRSRRRSPSFSSLSSRSPSPPPRHRPRSTRGGRDRGRDTRRNPSPHSRRRTWRPSPSSSPSPSRTPSPSNRHQPLPRSAGLALAQEAAQHALEAGAKAAVRLRDDPSPWLGRKGGQIAAAALSAAVVDTFVARRHPKMRKGGMRHSFATQAAQMVFGGLVPGGNDGNAAGAGTRKKGGVGSRMGGLRGRM